MSLDQGEVQYCRARDGRDCWSIVFVDAGGAVVLPLAVGPLARAMKVVERLGEGPRLWDRSRYRPPSVIVGGRRHYFRPTKGTILVGVVEVGSCVLLLGAVGEELAVIRVEGKTRRALYVGRPDGFAEINVDRCLSLDEGLGGGRAGRATPRAASVKRPRATTASPSEPVAKVVRASAKTEAQHRRILEGVAVDPDHAHRVQQVLRCGFADIARRAMEPEERAAKKLRGKRSVELVLEMVCELAIRGVDDFGGRNGEIAARLRECFPGREITEHGLGHALRLIVANMRADPHRLHVGVQDPRSPKPCISAAPEVLRGDPRRRWTTPGVRSDERGTRRQQRRRAGGSGARRDRRGERGGGHYGAIDRGWLSA